LIGFLEEKKKSYVEYIKELIFEQEKAQSKFAQYKEEGEEEEEEESGFFSGLNLRKIILHY
jgi:hypothetical protein